MLTTTDNRDATRSVVLPRVADDGIARMMRKPNRARLKSDAALLLPSDIGLLVRHDLDRLGQSVARSRSS
jgi:hypothetical protein